MLASTSRTARGIPWLRSLAWLHRWTGVLVSLLFFIWFASGAVLSFVPFPALSDGDRLAMSATLNRGDILISPAQALAAAGGGDSLELAGLPGRAVYVVGRGSEPSKVIDARSGVAMPPLSASQALGIAALAGRARVKAVVGPFDYDQWVVHQGFDRDRPLFRVALDDGQGTNLYISSRTGRIVQRTRAGERAWNWAGAIPHWIYFTALRKSWAAWDQTVWWISLLGVFTAAAGAYLGIHRTAARLSHIRPNWSPFRGWLRWHHGFGLAAGLFVISWIVSGWLSMDHGRLFSRGAPRAQQAERYQGRPLNQALASVGPDAIAPLLPASRITFAVVGGRPIAASAGDAGRVLQLDATAKPQARLSADVIAAAAARAWPLAGRSPSAPQRADALYRLAEEMPDRTISFALEGSGGYVYLDPLTGQILAVMDPSRQAYAWVYYALHTFQVPGLIGRPALRRAIEFTFLALGLAFSATGLVISVKRLSLTFASRRSAPEAAASIRREA